MKVELTQQQVQAIVNILASVSVPVKDADQVKLLIRAVSTPIKEEKKEEPKKG